MNKTNTAPRRFVLGILWSPARAGSMEMMGRLRPAHLCDYTIAEWARRAGFLG